MPTFDRQQVRIRWTVKFFPAELRLAGECGGLAGFFLP